MSDHCYRVSDSATGGSSKSEYLVLAHQKVAERLARRYSRGIAVDEDLLQVAFIGLVLASQRYDPAKGPFRPYAVATVSGELKKHLRDHGWSVRVSRRVQEHTIAIDRATSELEQSLGRSPTPQEIADLTGLQLEEVLVGARAQEVRFSEPLPIIDPAVESVDEVESVIIAEALGRLDERQAALVQMSFLEELSQREIATRLAISQSQVHRRLKSALRDLRVAFDKLGYVST